MKNENYQEMFNLALEGEGKMLKGYSLFHNYSFFNQMYVMFQLLGRGMNPAPIATFKRWQELGRSVKKGEKALELCVPRSWHNKETDEEGMYFTFRKGWFALSQTEGSDVEFPEVGFNFEKCLETLGIKTEEFQLTSGNCQGYAKKGVIAINPIAELPAKTFFHEVAHVLLHLEGDEEFVDNPTTEKNIKEVEAESVAMCVSIALGLDENIPYCRGYVKGWLKGNEFPVESVKKVFRATDKILKAGTSES
jgi:antirestriction protein ArdC